MTRGTVTLTTGAVFDLARLCDALPD